MQQLKTKTKPLHSALPCYITTSASPTPEAVLWHEKHKSYNDQVASSVALFPPCLPWASATAVTSTQGWQPESKSWSLNHLGFPRSATVQDTQRPAGCAPGRAATIWGGQFLRTVNLDDCKSVMDVRTDTVFFMLPKQFQTLMIKWRTFGKN